MSPSTAPRALPAYPPAPPGVVRLLRRWHRLECWIAVLAFSFIAVVLAIDVLGREAYGPVMAPLAMAYGYDKVMFGIIMIVNLEIGFLTPPVGLNLLVAMSTFKQKFGELVLAAVPFIVLMLGCLALIAWQPWISQPGMRTCKAL